MKLLLDTHIVVWLATDRSRLSAGELAVILDPDNEIAISTVTIWEIRIKWQKYYSSGNPKGPVDPQRLLLALQEMELNVLPLGPDHCAARLDQQLTHGDPFDDLLLTIAQEMDCQLLTRDSQMRGHPMALHAD